MEMTVRDAAEPFMNELIDRNPRVVAKALRWTAFHHRVKLKQAMKDNDLGMEPKKELGEKAKDRFLRGPASRRPMIKAKHLRSTRLPFRSKRDRPDLRHALRVAKASGGKDATSYQFGFIGDNSRGSKFGGKDIPAGVREAARYMEALAKGQFLLNPKVSSASSNNVTPRMRRYYKWNQIGIKREKTRLDFPKRPVVARYFKTYKSKIVADFKKRFAIVLKRERERIAKDAYRKVRKTTYSTNASKFIRSRLGA